MPRMTAVDAIERLFALYEQPMFRIALAVLKDEGQAEDAVMTAFERVVRRQGVPCDPDSAHAQRLMMKMAKQCAIDLYRKNAREWQRFAAVAGEKGAEVADERACFGRSAEEAEELLARLPQQYRDVLHDRFVEDFSTRETAEHLGISEANVRKRQQRGLDLLRRNKNGGDTIEPLYCS